jgi:hypothetical protein
VLGTLSVSMKADEQWKRPVTIWPLDQIAAMDLCGYRVDWHAVTRPEFRTKDTMDTRGMEKSRF